MSLNLTEGLRYFFAPFVVYFYLYLYDSSMAARLSKELETIGIIAALVSGTVMYFLYRYYLYDGLILWLHDICRGNNYRIFLHRRYNFPYSKYYLSSNKQALRLFWMIRDKRLNDFLNKTQASAIHLLYQAGILALIFALFSIGKGWPEIIVFSCITLVLLVAAVGMDIEFEDKECLILEVIIKEDPTQVDQAAALLGLAKKESVV